MAQPGALLCRASSGVCQWWCSVSAGRRRLVAQPGALLCRASSAVFVSGGAVLVLDALYTVYCLLPPTVRTVSSKPHTLARHVSFMQRERQATCHAVHHSHTLARHVSFMQATSQAVHHSHTLAMHVSFMQRKRQATSQAVHHSHTLARHVSFMQRERQGMSVSCGIFLKMCRPYKHQIYGGNMCKYISKLIETNYPISFHRGLDT